jgi:hypothetical protein
MKSTIFWNITPCSPLKVDRHFGGTRRLHDTTMKACGKQVSPAFMLICCSAYSTLKTEAICSSETSVDFQQTTWCYIPEDSTLHNHRDLYIHSVIRNINRFAAIFTYSLMMWHLNTGCIFCSLFDSLYCSKKIDKILQVYKIYGIHSGVNLYCGLPGYNKM